MLSPLAAWRVSFQRMRSDWPIVAAAWLITLLAATLLAAGPVYSDAVSLAGLRRVLADAPPAAANIEVGAVVPLADVATADAEVERLVRSAIGSVGATVHRNLVSDTFALPGQPEDEVRDLATFGSASGIADHATLLEGGWPESVEASGAVPVAVLDGIAETLGWSVGDEMVLTNRRDGRTLAVRVAGIYAVADGDDPYWWAEPQALEGVTESATYRTFGPLIGTPEDVLQRVASGNVRMAWRAFPAFDELRIEQVGSLRGRVAQLQERIRFAIAGTFPDVHTDLPALLADAQRSLLVTRTGVLLLVVQLAVLAAYAIVLTAGLLADHRRLDTALLRSRGAGPLQVAALALIEALVLAVPAALLAPFLAAAALSAFNLAGPLAEVGLEVQPEITSLAFGVAGTAAVGAALLLVLPAFLAARSFVDESSGRSRFETRTVGQRLGIDIALLGITAIALWQLRLYGAPLTESVHGTLGLDPLLVAAPAIGLLAGGVLALRVVPLLASAAEALTRRGRRLVGALGAQQVARRPLRYTRAALLVMLAVSMGVFAISYTETWHSSQEDQAGHQVGADLRLQAAGGAGNVPAWTMAAALQRVDGIEAFMAVERETMRLSGAGQPGELLAVDPVGAESIMVLREDLVGEDLAAHLARLTEERPLPALVTIDGAPARLRVDAELELVDAFTPRVDHETGEPFRDPLTDEELVGRGVLGAEVVLRDANGLVTRFTAAPVPLVAGAEAVVIDLDAGTPRTVAQVGEIGGGFSPPLEVLAVDVTVTLPFGAIAQGGRVALEGIATSDAPDGDDWQPVDLDAAGGWSVSVLRNPGSQGPPPPELLGERSLTLAADFPVVGPRTGLRPPAVSFTAAALDELAEMAVPAVVDEGFLESTAAVVGDEVLVRLGGVGTRVKVIGTLAAFPTVDPGPPLAVADLSTLGLVRFATSQATLAPREWWVATAPGQDDAVASTLDAGPYVRGAVAAREERARSLSADPVALGIIGALSLGFIVAGLFAVIGLAVSAAVSARQRRTEFALLRALGLSSGQLSGWLWLENAGIVLVSLAAGTGLGLVIGWVVLPFVTVTQQATTPFPPPLVRMPWASIGILLAVSTAALGATVMILAHVLRRIGIGSVLRMGED